MRLSEWRGRSPHKDSLTAKVVAVIEPIITALGADADPECWIAWGDDPAVRYLILVPTTVGLAEVHVRVNVPQEGPRASGKLVRWSRVQVGELAIEMAQGHRLLTFQVESQVLRGSDADADAIAAFALSLFAAIDGKTIEPRPAARTRAGSATRAKGGAGTPARTAATGKPATRQLPATREP